MIGIEGKNPTGVGSANMPKASLKRGIEQPIPVPTTVGGTAEVAKKIADKAGVSVGSVYEVHAVQKKGYSNSTKSSCREN